MFSCCCIECLRLTSPHATCLCLLPLLLSRRCPWTSSGLQKWGLPIFIACTPPYRSTPVAAFAAASAAGLQVSLDVQVGDRLGRLVLGLYGNVVPQTVSSQFHICTHPSPLLVLL
jgi:hypothetical protein